MSDKYAVIYYDGNNERCKIHEFNKDGVIDGPFGATPEKLGLPEGSYINSMVQLATESGFGDYPIVVIDGFACHFNAEGFQTYPKSRAELDQEELENSDDV